MTLNRNLSRLAAAVATLTLAGCITLLPDSQPAQLYRFTPDPLKQIAPAPTEGRTPLIRAGGNFHPAAAGDRILTAEGAKAAYLANARWTQSASVLFDQALVAAFASSTGPARLITPGELGRPAFGLRVDVSRFEADYDKGPRAAPEVRVNLHVVVTRLRDQKVVREQSFTVTRRASENRSGAIAEAFRDAASEALGAIITTADEGVAAGPAA
ncbi:ABC-type transport auxiliary lipoprotein family protein [Phenylobacterium sp.]|uniref:ABC-type transport auxiliary lipoprotein family protein n=1 Tax=Phenylobacterium sp. TaxID=1871053 RepID=UPI0025E501DA|nr:ABC-type transport auxiliary lipoprotein family protein [Phenylobacterium sp.]MCA3714383.1 membrane integrity-associated transporter subunit PqiC [Phenylobacterium sp.]